MNINRADGRRKDYEPKTDFQRWLKPYLDSNARNGITPGDYKELFQELIRRGMDVTENYVYRVVRGNPVTYVNARRPGYEVAHAIGEIIGDLPGALKAARYQIGGDLSTASAVSIERKLERIPDEDTIQLLDAYEGLPPTYRKVALEQVQELQELVKGFQRRQAEIANDDDD